MTRYHARWIHPVSSSPIEHATLVEKQGRIAWVGARDQAPEDEGSDIDLGDAVLLPGLVNAHCHLELSAMRGFLDGLGFREWILTLTAARRAVLTTPMMLDASRLSIEEGLVFGVTTFADTGDSGTGFDAMLEYGVRGVCYREVFGPDPAQCTPALSELQVKLAGMLERQTSLARVGVSPHAPYTVSDELFASVARLALAQNLPMAVHIAESQLESDLVVRGEGAFAEGLRKRNIAVEARARSPIALLERLGVLETHPLLIHCVDVNEDDMAAMRAHDCGVAHCPTSNARFAHEIAPLAALLERQLRVGLGTDSVASNDRMVLLEEARLAGLLASVRERRTDALSPAAAVELATLGGARALRLDDEIGSLEPGKAADLAAFSLDAVRAPVHDPVVALVHALSDSRATLVVVAGDVKVANGGLRSSNHGLARRVQASADALAAWSRDRKEANAP